MAERQMPLNNGHLRSLLGHPCLRRNTFQCRGDNRSAVADSVKLAVNSIRRIRLEEAL
jgi:hypothetical protein